MLGYSRLLILVVCFWFCISELQNENLCKIDLGPIGEKIVLASLLREVFILMMVITVNTGNEESG